MRRAYWMVVPCLVLMSAACVDIVAFGGVQGSGVSKSEQRSLAPFNAIGLAGSADVRVTIAEKQSVAVEGDDNILPLIETSVASGKLEISTKTPYSSRIGVTVTITVPALDSVGVAGSGDVSVTGLDAESFVASVAGSGVVRATGKARRVEAKVAGSGDIDFSELKAAEASAAVTGSGDIRIHATDSLSASVTGSGDISYSGTPKNVSRNVLGSGDVRPD